MKTQPKKDRKLSEQSITKKNRVLELVELYKMGYTRLADFLEYSKSKNWGVSPRTIENYQREAKKEFFKMAWTSKKDYSLWKTGLIREMIEKELIAGNYKGVRESLDKLDKVIKPESIEIFKESNKKEKVKHSKKLEDIERLLDEI